jgi:aconitase B
MGELSDYADEMLRNKTPVKINKEDIEFVLNNKLAILDLINEGLASPKAQEDAIKTIEKNMQRLEQLFKGESIDANRLDVVRNEF